MPERTRYLGPLGLGRSLFLCGALVTQPGWGRAEEGPPSGGSGAQGKLRSQPRGARSVQASQHAALAYRIEGDVLRVTVDAAAHLTLATLKLPGLARDLRQKDHLLVIRLLPCGVAFVDVSTTDQPRLLAHEPQLDVREIDIAGAVVVLRLQGGEQIQRSVASLSLPALTTPAAKAGSAQAAPGGQSGAATDAQSGSQSGSQVGCGPDATLSSDVRVTVVQDALTLQSAQAGCTLGSLRLPGPARFLTRYQHLLIVSLNPRGLWVIDASRPQQPRVVHRLPKLEVVAQGVDGDTLQLRMLDGERLDESLSALARRFGPAGQTATAGAGTRPQDTENASGDAAASTRAQAAQGPDYNDRLVQGTTLPRCALDPAPAAANDVVVVTQGYDVFVLGRDRSCWHGAVTVRTPILESLHHDRAVYVSGRDRTVTTINLRQPREPVVRDVTRAACLLKSGLRMAGTPTRLLVPTLAGGVAVYPLDREGVPSAGGVNWELACGISDLDQDAPVASGRDTAEVDAETPRIARIRRAHSERRESESPGLAAMIVGGSLLAGSYVLTVVPVILADAVACRAADKDCVHGVFYVPILGPWIDLGVHSWGSTGYVPIISGLLQGAALVTLIAGGALNGRDAPGRRNAWRVFPSVGGLAVGGRF